MQNTYFNVKNLRNIIFRASRRVSFPYFPKVALDVCVCLGGGVLKTFQSFRGLCYNIQFKLYATSKMELMAGNCC